MALARGLVNRPGLLLLDEPLGALDAKLRVQMQYELMSLQRDVGITFVFVTHAQDEALSLSHRIAVMNAGRVEQIDEPARLYGYPHNRFVAGFIGSINLFDCEVLEAGDATMRLRVDRLGEVQAPARAELRSAERLQPLPGRDGDLAEIGVMRPLVDRGVERIVRLGIAGGVAGPDDAGHLRVLRIERFPLGCRHHLGAEPGAQRLEIAHHLEHAGELVGRGLCHQGARMRLLVHQPARRQQPQGIAHRGARYRELAGQLRLIERRAGFQLAGNDAAGQHAANLLAGGAFQHSPL